MCNWRKEHNRIEEFNGVPNNKNLEQSNVQLQKEIVKDVEVKQQKKMTVFTQEQMQEMIRIMKETFEQHRKEMREIFRNNTEELDQKIEDNREETELKEDKSILLSANKNNSNTENIQTMEMKTKKRHPRKLINTREGGEMIKNGLINMFNIPITNHEEIINVQDYRRRSIKILEMTYYKATGNNFKKSLDKRNIPPLERYTKLSMKQQITKVPLKISVLQKNR